MAPFGGVVYLEETGISTWKDLEGKTIGQYPWGSTGPVAKAAMRKKGVDLSTISFQNVQPGSARKLQLKGELDAMIRYVPQELAWMDLHGYAADAFSSVEVLNHMGVGMIVRDDFLDKNPDHVSNLVAGWLDGIKMWANQTEKVTQKHKRMVKSESSVKWNGEYYERLQGPIFAAYTPEKSLGTSKGKGWIELERMKTTLEVFSDAGLLDSKLDAESIFTNRFIEEHRDLAVGTAESLYTKLESYDVGPNYLYK
ncbi:MAG: ABC transporter substrate-binding protein [Halanaeroarchaeum sp.]